MKRVFFSLGAGMVGCAWALQASAAAIAKSKETVILSFDHKDGASPQAGLIDVKGTLYGTSNWGPNCSLENEFGCGTVFSVKPTTGAETVLYPFCSQPRCTDGQFPEGGVIDVNGTLYGTTEFGGAHCTSGTGCGTIFSVNPASGAETVLYSFCKLDYPNCTDGAIPVAGLIAVDGTLYGTTAIGGANGSGTLFAFNPKTGAETVLYSFCAQQNCSDGSEPFAGLIDLKGTLYGTTQLGGADGDGTIFAFDMTTASETVLHSFSGGTDGAQPYTASLIDVQGTLYGTTLSGGGGDCKGEPGGCGTVFSLDIATGTESVLYAFCRHSIRHQCRDGDSPVASLINVKGILYGTTQFGGTYTNELPGNGVVFAVDPTTRTETVLDAFQSRKKNGANPCSDLIDVTGLLYGTTASGGAHADGTVFALRP